MSELTGGASHLGWAALKAVLMFTVAVAGLRIGERRTLAQLGAFDFVVAVAVGALIGRTATSSTTSFATGAVVLSALLLAHRMITELRRHHWLGSLVDAPPRVLVSCGRPRDRELAKAGLTLGDLCALLRQHNVAAIEDVQYLLYESRGAITLVAKDDAVGPLVRDGLAAAHITPPNPGSPLASPSAAPRRDQRGGRHHAH
jgi:uncharacterized membrane protein YcaP (DUF421 family)